MTVEVGQRLYRLVDREVVHGSYDMNGEWLRTSHVSIELQWEVWLVEKLTPKGFWAVEVDWFPDGRREPEHCDIRARRVFYARHWVRLATRSRLRLATTKHEAATLAAQKRRHHVACAQARLQSATRRLDAIERLAIKLEKGAPT